MSFFYTVFSMAAGEISTRLTGTPGSVTVIAQVAGWVAPPSVVILAVMVAAPGASAVTVQAAPLP